MNESASMEGTSHYKEIILKKYKIPETHFREFLGFSLSSIGMGTYLGNPDTYTDNLVTQAVLQSIEGGINVFDTAINYRYQKAERSIGKALKKVKDIGFSRDEIFISSKIGYIPGDADIGMDGMNYINEVILKNQLAQEEDIIGMNCMTVPYLKHQLKQSLRNLGLKTIDLLYLHNVADAEKAILGEDAFYKKLENAFTFLEEMVVKNKIKYYGLATWDSLRVNPTSPDYLNLKIVTSIANNVAESIRDKESRFKFVMLPYNYLMPEATTLKNQEGYTIIEKAKQLNIGIFGAVPLMQARAMKHPNLTTIKQKYGVDTPAQAALQFVRSVGKPLIAPLVGHKNPNHVNENLELVKKFSDF